MTRSILFFQAMRPKHWTKNVLLFGGIAFSKHLFDADLLVRSFLGFLVFCVLSG
nr:decaprenyl-phosphate phosphoribosyltransferase [Bacillota bacterium]